MGVVIRIGRPLLGFARPLIHLPNSYARQRAHSTAPLTKEEVRRLLSSPNWSVSTLNEKPLDGDVEAEVTSEQLHHLLQLSALPIPKPEEERPMIETLASQLRFVNAIQRVDTTGVEPLTSIRDETHKAQQENEVTLESLKGDLCKEQTVGFAGRIVKEQVDLDTDEIEAGDSLKLAPKKVGRFIVVNTKTS